MNTTISEEQLARASQISTEIRQQISNAVVGQADVICRSELEPEAQAVVRPAAERRSSIIASMAALDASRHSDSGWPDLA